MMHTPTLTHLSHISAYHERSDLSLALPAFLVCSVVAAYDIIQTQDEVFLQLVESLFSYIS